MKEKKMINLSNIYKATTNNDAHSRKVWSFFKNLKESPPKRSKDDSIVGGHTLSLPNEDDKKKQAIKEYHKKKHYI